MILADPYGDGAYIEISADSQQIKVLDKNIAASQYRKMENMIDNRKTAQYNATHKGKGVFDVKVKDALLLFSKKRAEETE